MKNININKITLLSLLYAAMATIAFIFISCMVIYFNQRDEAVEESSIFHRKLLMVFDENENISDAITTKFTSLVQKGKCSPPLLYKGDGFYGFNYSEDTRIKGDSNSLLSLQTLSKESDCLISAASTISKNLSESDLVTRKGYRYILSKKGMFIYSFHPITTDVFDIRTSKMFDDMTLFIPDTPEYLKRKLTKNIKSKGTVATPLYVDSVTGQKAYSVVSFIYNMNETKAPVAYLLYDHNLKELNNIIGKRLRDNHWVNVNIVQLNDNDVLCISNCFKRHKYTSSVSMPLSEMFKVEINIDIFKSIYSTNQFKFVILLSLVLFFALQYFIRFHKLKSQQDSVIDHLTKLYTRKIIPMINPGKSGGKFVAIIDCNEFKAINDIHGHNAGDEILIFIGKTIKSSIRSQDIPIRHGGDEFMIIIESDTLEVARAILDRIMMRIADKEFQFNGCIVHTSISYGIAVYSGDWKDTIQKADEEMYIMKGKRESTKS